jgi:hypothetical protein
MYDVSPRFLNQLAVDRRATLSRSAAASLSTSPGRALRALVARFRRAPVAEQPRPMHPRC